MTDQRKTELEKVLNDHGLTVMLTKDHNAMLFEMVLLRRFDRLIRCAAAVDTPLAMLVKDIDKVSAKLRASLPQPA